MCVCFIVLHYRKADETARCIESILKMDGSDKMQILVVDNSMDDDSGQALRENYRDHGNIYVMPSEKDAGFSRANNIGYQYAVRNFHPDFIVIVNNDIEFLQQDFKKQMEEAYQQTHFAVLGPDVLHALTGGHQSPIDLKLRTEEEAKATIKKNRIALRLSDFLYPVINLILSSLYENKGNGLAVAYDKRHENVVVMGACLIFSREFIDRCEKAFYPETEFFYEEYILAYRCEQLGLKMIYDPAIKVRHESGAAIQQSYRDRKMRLKFILSNTMKGCRVYLDYRKKGYGQDM